LEKDRQPFEVIERETTRTVEIGGVQIEIRADRVDRLEDATIAILDYKTGQHGPSEWEGDRPDEPQLPLYAIASEDPVGGIFFAGLKTGKMRFRGVADSDGRVPGVAGSGDVGLAEKILQWRSALGRLGEAWLLASETCALDIIGGKFVRDVEPGEIVVIDDKGLHSLKPFNKAPERFCIFEYIYFARPDSVMEGRNVYEVRKAIGAELARESHVAADLVVPVPDSGVPAAIGYAQQAKVPFEFGIVRNHYVGRTFIEPTDQIRHLGVRLKHNANAFGLKGKRVVLVDDSIVRGTTSTKIVEMVRNAGAKEVHMRISSPPTTHSCFYGIDTPQRDELLAAQFDVAAMSRHINVDSLAFLSIDGLYRALGEARRNVDQPQYCDACFTGEYPIPLIDHDKDPVQRQLSLLDERE